MRSPAAWVRGVRYPHAFHGHGRSGGFFEGWYIKAVNADRSQRWAIIPGVFRGTSGDGETDESFVQVLDGLTGRSWYHRFDAEEFRASDREFAVAVGPNLFDARGATLDLPQLSGRLEFATPMDPWPVTWREPGIMGWYGFVPFMECFHGVVSFGHDLDGALSVEGVERSFAGGRGYIEKDWGKAFPAGYVWMATNHVDTAPEASLVASVAIIPWLRSSFRGFIVGLRHDGRLFRWTTYNGTRETRLSIDDDAISWRLTGPDGTLELDARRVRGGLLRAPERTAMHERVEETLDADVLIRHVSATGEVLLEGSGACAGLEVYGDIERLVGLRVR